MKAFKELSHYIGNNGRNAERNAWRNAGRRRSNSNHKSVYLGTNCRTVCQRITPAYVETHCKYKQDVEYADKIRAVARERFHKLSRDERDEINKRSNDRYKNDPEYCEKKKQRAKERSARLRAQRRAARAAAL